VFPKFSHPKIVLSWDALVAPAVEEGHEVYAVARRLGVSGRIGERHFDSAGRLPLHEHIVQNALRVHPFRVKDGIPAAERLEPARIELSELRLLDRRLAQQLGLTVRLGYLHEHQPSQSQGNHGGKTEQWREQPRRPESAGLQRSHLAVVVQAAQSQHHGQQ
jgi:hypothetical protein